MQQSNKFNSPTSMYSWSTLPDDNNALVRASSSDKSFVGVDIANDFGRLRFGVTVKLTILVTIKKLIFKNADKVTNRMTRKKLNYYFTMLISVSKWYIG